MPSASSRRCDRPLRCRKLGSDVFTWPGRCGFECVREFALWLEEGNAQLLSGKCCGLPSGDGMGASKIVPHANALADDFASREGSRARAFSGEGGGA